MSLSGSASRRWWGRWSGRFHPAGTPVPTPPPTPESPAAGPASPPPPLAVRLRRARPLRAGRVTRDFTLWEAEIGPSVDESVTLTTVIGRQVVEVTVGHRPIEEVALHLRRLRSVMDAMSPDVSFVRWEGVIRAYDDYLFAACRELGVPTDLVVIGFGRHRDEERCRLERLLGKAGLPVR